MKSRVPALVFIIGVLAALTVPAADRPVRGNVLVLVSSTTAEEDQEFRALLLSVLRIETEDRELAAIEPEAQPPAEEKPWESAKKADAEFALVATYTMGQNEAAFDLAWYETAAKKLVQTVSCKASLDFTLDVSIATALVEILDAQKDRISALPLKTTAAGTAAVTPSAEVPVNAAELGKDVVRLETVKPFSISLGAAPLIPTFDATKYVSYKYFSMKTVIAWHFPILGGAGGIGLTGAFQRYRVDNLGHPGMFIGIPVGAEVQYGTRMPGPFDFFFHADGGALIWYLNQDSGSQNNGFSWYILGGVGFEMDVLKFLGMGVDLTFAYYYGYPPLTILEPTVFLLLKL